MSAPLLAKIGTPHASGLGKTRWVVERTLAWLHHFRRLRICWERSDDIHLALLVIGAVLIAFSFLQEGSCEIEFFRDYPDGAVDSDRVAA